ncbi:MAG: Gfo/Idh/MocA family oxidoreductase [Elusimicrobiales bacterium]
MKGAFIGGRDALSRLAGGFAAAGLELPAFCPDGAAGAAPLPRGLRLLGSAEELFSEPGLDFAAVSLPAGRAAAVIELALKRGLHAVCEPPFCASTTEFEALRAAAAEAGRSVFPLQPWERSPVLRALEKALDRGLAGEINYTCVQELVVGPPPAEPAAALWRPLSLLLSCARLPPVAVAARNPGGPAAAVHAHFNGADGFAHVAFNAAEARLKISVSGAAGRLEADGGLLRLDVEGAPREDVEFSDRPDAARPEWLAAELAEFRKEMEGTSPRGSGLRNARYCVKLIRNSLYSASVKSAAVPL